MAVTVVLKSMKYSELAPIPPSWQAKLFDAFMQRRFIAEPFECLHVLNQDEFSIESYDVTFLD